MKPYLTKVAIGRHWWYIDTNRRWSIERRLFGRWLIVRSYRKVYDYQGKLWMVTR